MKVEVPPAVMLDLDDTIVQFSVQKAKYWNTVCSEFSSQLQQRGVTDFVPSVLRTSEEFWSNEKDHGKWRQNMKEARRIVVEDTLKKYGVVDDALSVAIADGYSAAKEEGCCPFPGSIETVERLKELGASLALVTNGSSASQRRKIEKFGLSRLFDHILIEGEQGYGKPDSRIFLDALAKMDVKPEDAWMIGDNQIWDIIPPQKLGMGTIWVNSKSAPVIPEISPILTLGSLSELMEYI